MISKKTIALIAGLSWISTSLAKDEQSTKINASQQAETHTQAEREMLRLSTEIQGLKKNVVQINKELNILEDQLLFPTASRLSVFVTITSGQFLELESVRLKINDRVIASHIYSSEERDALKRGGVQPLTETNLLDGLHEVTALFTGIGPGGTPYKRAVTHQLDKDSASQYLEIAISDSEKQQAPVFAINIW